MTKEKYIIELRKRLSILRDEEVDDIVEEYLDYIKQKENEGISEGLALEQLGNVNDLAKKVLESYKISNKYIKLFIGKEKIVDEINDLVTKIAEKSGNVFEKVEESVTEIAKTASSVAKNFYQGTRKFGEEKFHDVKNMFNKKHQDEEDEVEIIDQDEVLK